MASKTDLENKIAELENKLNTLTVKEEPKRMVSITSSEMDSSFNVVNDEAEKLKKKTKGELEIIALNQLNIIKELQKAVKSLEAK